MDSPVLDFVFLTVTCGTATVPFLAIRTPTSPYREYPHAAQILQKQIDVDDVFSGTNSLPHAVEPRDQLIGLLRTAGISLGKWAADSRIIHLQPEKNSVYLRASLVPNF